MIPSCEQLYLYRHRQLICRDVLPLQDRDYSATFEGRLLAPIQQRSLLFREVLLRGEVLKSFEHYITEVNVLTTTLEP